MSNKKATKLIRFERESDKYRIKRTKRNMNGWAEKVRYYSISPIGGKILIKNNFSIGLTKENKRVNPFVLKEFCAIFDNVDNKKVKDEGIR